MSIERGLRLAAGIVILLSVSSLSCESFWLRNGLRGLNLLQSAFTNWCPMVWFLARLGLQPCVVQIAGTAPNG